MTIGRAFWSEECPARGPGLTHAHWHKCAEHHTDPTHYIDQCCECGGRASEWGVRINAETIPDYSVARRMQEM